MTAVAVLDDVRTEAAEQLVLDEKAFSLFAPLKAIAQEGGLTAVSLDLSAGGDLDLGTYEKLGAYLGLMNRSCMWWVGDWLVYGEGRFGDSFAQAAASTGLAEQTLLNRMYVCRNVAPEIRRVALGFSVHAEVASCSTAREQRKWLDRAERGNWNRQQLREAMKATRKDTSPVDLDDDPGEGVVDTQRVVEAAKRILSEKEDYGDRWLVSKEAIAVLAAALGEE
jgi:hypothetical protein